MRGRKEEGRTGRKEDIGKGRMSVPGEGGERNE
jgi:hypothetical protein